MVSQLIAEAAPNVDAAAHPIQLLVASAGHAFLCMRVFNISSGLAAECVLPISCRWRPVLPALPPGAVRACVPFRFLNQSECHLPRFVNGHAILQQKSRAGVQYEQTHTKTQVPCPPARPAQFTGCRRQKSKALLVGIMKLSTACCWGAFASQSCRRGCLRKPRACW